MASSALAASSDSLPLCAVCCDVLGKYGGPSTLPCGHNGCLECLSYLLKNHAPQCPLCRTRFDPSISLVCNHELRDLIALATATLMDEATKAEGWQAFPSAELTRQQYAADVSSVPRALSYDACYGPPAAPCRAPAAQGTRGGGGSSSSSAGGSGEAAGTAQLQWQRELQQPPGLPTSGPAAAQQDLLRLEPPQWLPDSCAAHCYNCQAPFKPLLRLRHHCRLCGRIYCHACSAKSLLLPPRFRQRDPQRVCDMCAALLEPLQPFLIGACAASSQPPVHDALDAVSLRSWLNAPWGACLADESFKAANIVRGFDTALRLEPERGLPTSLLAGARGLALLSSVRVGAGWSATAGTGLLVSRQRSGAWSAPCAIACYGLGLGFGFGAQLTDVLLVLRTEEAVRAFAAGTTLGLGAAAGAALGPLGRVAEASLVGGLGARSHARGAVAGYSCSKGAFAGVCLEGSVTVTRDAVNQAFYGHSVTPRQLLLDCTVPQPPAASLLYRALDALMAHWEQSSTLAPPQAGAAHVAAAAASCCAAAAAKQAGVGSSASARALGSSAGSSSSVHAEWAVVDAFAEGEAEPDALDWQPPAQHEGGQYAAASAPPAPPSMLAGYGSSAAAPPPPPPPGGSGRATAAAAAAAAAATEAAMAAALDEFPSAPRHVAVMRAERSSAAARRQQEEQEEGSEDEQVYALEWD